jgi:hypothetical protein
MKSKVLSAEPPVPPGRKVGLDRLPETPAGLVVRAGPAVNE